MKRAIGDRERARGRRPACASFSTLDSIGRQTNGPSFKRDVFVHDLR